MKLNEKPVPERGGFNTYAYTFNNPLRWVDPTGLLSCTYQIATHSLSCTNNAGQSMSTTGVKSGRGSCQDNTSCVPTENEGPLPPGTYTIQPSGYSPNRPTWLYLQPGASNQMHNRSGFFIHPWGISNGCITIYFNTDFNQLSNWATQDGGGDLTVTQ